jgi:hypothetical protein
MARFGPKKAQNRQDGPRYLANRSGLLSALNAGGLSGAKSKRSNPRAFGVDCSDLVERDSQDGQDFSLVLPRQILTAEIAEDAETYLLNNLGNARCPE